MKFGKPLHSPNALFKFPSGVFLSDLPRVGDKIKLHVTGIFLKKLLELGRKFCGMTYIVRNVPGGRKLKI